MKNKKGTPLSILISEDEFFDTKKAGNEQDLESGLTELMKLANEHYDAVYLKYKNNPDIEKFNFCKENFQKIKSIIEEKKLEITSQLIKKFHFEAWISTLYSDVHALNLEPKTEKQLIELEKKILDIGTDFNKLQLRTKKSSLDLNDKSTDRLSKYIHEFEQTWKTKGKKLLADIYYNFAETLVEKSKEKLETNKHISLEDAQQYFMQSADFYKQANLLEFADEAKKRMQALEIAPELQNLSNRNHFVSPDKKLVVVLTRLSPSLKNKGIKAESVWTASYKQALDKLPEVADQPILPQLVTKKIDKLDPIKPIRRKRKSLDNDIQSAKKLKINPSVAAYHEIKLCWKTECKQLLNEFTTMRIDDNLEGILNFFHAKSFNERRAITCNNYAITIIKNLIHPRKNVSDSRKLDDLKKAKSQFIKSAEFYTLTGLIKEKGKVIECINTITSSIEKLKVLVHKVSVENSILSTNKKSSFNKQRVSRGKLDLPIRCTRTFFKSLSRPENNATNIDSQNNLDNKPVYFS